MLRVREHFLRFVIVSIQISLMLLDAVVPINSLQYINIVQKMLHQFQNPHESTIICSERGFLNDTGSHLESHPHKHRSFFSSPEYCRMRWVYIAISTQGLYQYSILMRRLLLLLSCEFFLCRAGMILVAE